MKQKIVLIEDDGILAKVMEEELVEAGFNVMRANDGKEGLALAQKEKPDVVLLDIVMPEMNGFEVLKELKDSPATKAIPVMLLTMLGSDDDIKKGLKLGAHDYVVKSQHAVGEIVEKVQGFLGGDGVTSVTNNTGTATAGEVSEPVATPEGMRTIPTEETTVSKPALEKAPSLADSTERNLDGDSGSPEELSHDIVVGIPDDQNPLR